MSRIDNTITGTIPVVVPSSSERHPSTWLFAGINTETDDISGLLSKP